MEFIRFFTVAVAGLFVDTGIAWLLFHKFGIPLTLSSTIGFMTAAALNYIMHELWTFKNGRRTLSSYRALSYIGVLFLTLGARVVAVHVLQQLFSPETFALAILIIAAGVSFIVNFLVSKFLVFNSTPRQENHPHEP